MSVVYADDFFRDNEMENLAQAEYAFAEADQVAEMRALLRRAKQIAAQHQSGFLRGFWQQAQGGLDDLLFFSNRQVLENAEIQQQIQERLSK